jgi:hypothetical protein
VKGRLRGGRIVAVGGVGPAVVFSGGGRTVGIRSLLVIERGEVDVVGPGEGGDDRLCALIVDVLDLPVDDDGIDVPLADLGVGHSTVDPGVVCVVRFRESAVFCHATRTP